MLLTVSRAAAEVNHLLEIIHIKYANLANLIVILAQISIMCRLYYLELGALYVCLALLLSSG